MYRMKKLKKRPRPNKGLESHNNDNNMTVPSERLITFLSETTTETLQQEWKPRPQEDDV
jgi:hypothetical protein